MPFTRIWFQKKHIHIQIHWVAPVFLDETYSIDRSINRWIDTDIDVYIHMYGCIYIYTILIPSMYLLSTYQTISPYIHWYVLICAHPVNYMMTGTISNGDKHSDSIGIEYQRLHLMNLRVANSWLYLLWNMVYELPEHVEFLVPACLGRIKKQITEQEVHRTPQP